jgi:hypothetical protein
MVSAVPLATSRKTREMAHPFYFGFEVKGQRGGDTLWRLDLGHPPVHPHDVLAIHARWSMSEIDSMTTSAPTPE